jgi:hypothetical protein
MYLPTIINAKPVSRYLIGNYLAVVLTDCESEGLISYQYAVIVYQMPADAAKGEQPVPMMAVAAEQSDALQDKNSFFLGVFPGDGHMNMGSSPDWGDLTKFTNKALEVIGNHLNVSQPPFLIPEDGGGRPN